MSVVDEEKTVAAATDLNDVAKRLNALLPSLKEFCKYVEK
jgi:hypothetical protein